MAGCGVEPEALRITHEEQSVSAPASGESVRLRIQVAASDGRVPTFAWSASAGDLSTSTDTASGSEVLWTAPNCRQAGPGADITVIATDAAKHSVAKSFRVNLRCSGWVPTASMHVSRQGHRTTLLPSGKVLVTGGESAQYDLLASAEEYDPATHAWTSVPDMSIGRVGAAALLLPSGKVLVAGGFTVERPDLAMHGDASAELYDPATRTWAPTGSMVLARANMAALLLPSGKVLVAGGHTGSEFMSSAELYDPATGTWSLTGDLVMSRNAPALTLLPTGQVLIVGALGTTMTELYDPFLGTWTRTGQLDTPRYSHTTTLLPSGQVLVTGGLSGIPALGTTLLYDPGTGIWSRAGGLFSPRAAQSATLLPSGQVLVAGGFFDERAFSTSELYDPALGTSMRLPDMVTARLGHTATLLPSGQVLVVGGTDGFVPTSAAELFFP